MSTIRCLALSSLHETLIVGDHRYTVCVAGYLAFYSETLHLITKLLWTNCLCRVPTLLEETITRLCFCPNLSTGPDIHVRDPTPAAAHPTDDGVAAAHPSQCECRSAGSARRRGARRAHYRARATTASLTLYRDARRRCVRPAVLRRAARAPPARRRASPSPHSRLDPPTRAGQRTVGAPVGRAQFRADWYLDYVDSKVQPLLDAVNELASHDNDLAAILRSSY